MSLNIDSNPKNSPIFNLKAVAQKTGLRPDTVRAWERRYGLPQPQRSQGGHRLYSQEDIDLLKWLIARQHEGLSISRAVDLWRNIQLETAIFSPPQPLTPVQPREEVLPRLRQDWIKACLNFDEQAAENVLTSAFALYSSKMVCFEILQKGLAQIGADWSKRITTVQQEHFASALAIRRLESLIAATAAPTRSKRILVGCPPEETHVFAPLLITFLLRRRGWEVLYLGANVPPSRLSATVRKTASDLIIMSAQQLHTAANLFDMALFLQKDGGVLAYGGSIFLSHPELVNHIPGYFLGPTLSLIIDQVAEILRGYLSPNPVKPVTAAYKQALDHYRERQARIEAYTWEHINDHRMLPVHLSKANLEFSRNIMAALTLGDMAFLSFDMLWLGLLSDDNIPLSQRQAYLEIYHQAGQIHLDATLGACILDWFAELGLRE